MATDKATSAKKRKAFALAARKVCSANYLKYVEIVNSSTNKDADWIPGKHLVFLCNKVQEFVEKDTGNAYDILILNLPPQHGKTSAITETLPSWYLGKHPDSGVIALAYGDDLAQRFGRRNKEKIERFGKIIFGISVSKNKSANDDFEIEGHKGRMITRGVMAGVTGNPAKCFVGDTLIATEIGQIPIIELFNMDKPPQIYTYNHSTKAVELESIVAMRRSIANEFATTRTTDGVQVRSTVDHLFAVNQNGEYKEAQLLRRGDGCVRLQSMPVVWQGKTERKQNLLGLFHADAISKRSRELRPMRRSDYSTTVRVRKEETQGFEEYVLRQDLHGSILQTTTQTQSAKRTQAKEFCCDIRRKGLPNLWRLLSTIFVKNSVLFKGLCKRSALKANDGNEQFKLQGWNKLFKTVSRNETANQGARGELLRSVWGARKDGHIHHIRHENKYANTSHRREPTEQRERELDNTLQNLSWTLPQVKRSTVKSVRVHSRRKQFVYDIQTEKNHNFFAEEILAHNCLIIDDPVRTKEEAFSPVTREKLWQEWQSSMKTRLANGAKVIIIMTRWHDDDLAGQILKTEKNVTHINLTCEAEEDDILGREVGDGLFPEIGKGKAWKDEMKASYLASDGMDAWMSMYQGQPVIQGGNVFKRDWFRWYKRKDLPTMYQTIISVDAAFKDTKTSDKVAMGVWGKSGSSVYFLGRINERMDFVRTVEAVRQLKYKHPQANMVLIEDKANGSAIISTLQREIMGVVPVNPLGSKESRAYAIQPFVMAGNVYLPEGEPWVEEYLDQMCRFPKTKFDDEVDQTSQALIRLKDFVANAPLGSEKKPHFNLLSKPKTGLQQMTGGKVSNSFMRY